MLGTSTSFAPASALAWARVFSFFGEHLRSGAELSRGPQFHADVVRHPAAQLAEQVEHPADDAVLVPDGVIGHAAL